MEIHDLPVGLIACRQYERRLLKEGIEQIAAALFFRLPAGARVVLKPNLISGRGHDGLACTHPQLCAAIAEWCLDQGARVTIGDSPAFGRATGVMAACGYDAAFAGLPVQRVDFSQVRPVTLASGLRVGIAAQALECDLLINLPRLKAHGQLLLTMGVKNYFGCVVGFRKPWLHAMLGDADHRFAGLLLDLLAVLPAGMTFLDGVVAMHVNGPLAKGQPFALGLLAGARNPVALDTALYTLLAVRPEQSPLWSE